MSFYPPIPISFVPTGNRDVAARMYQEGRRRAGQLYNALSGGYGNPHFDSIDNRLFSGKSGPFYYLTESGYFITIHTRIEGELTYVSINAVPREEAEEIPGCRCCRDCIAIGAVIEKIFPFGATEPPKYVVDLCFQQKSGPPLTVRLIDGAYAADGNPAFLPSEKYIVLGTPALWNPDPEPPATTNCVPVTTNLKTWQGDVDWSAGTTAFRRPRVWQVFDCMELSDVNTEGVDLLPVGIDNSLYSEKNDICLKGGGSIPIEDPETAEEPIPVVALRFILTSMRAGDCLELTE